MTYTILDTANKIRNKTTSIFTTTKLMFDNIKSNNLNAYIATFENKALEKAKTLDENLSQMSSDEKEKLPLLYGIPLAIKDMFCTKEGKTTGASKILENYQSPIESTITQNLLKHNAIFVGKANLDDNAMGSSNETSYFGNVKNPLDNSHSAGGSSGGSAAAVASNQALGSLGTDTGGSVRLPASYTGLVAIRPTYGSCSRYGILEFASSFDQPGPITKTVKDNAILLNNMYGHDPKDARSIQTSAPCFLKSTEDDISTYTVGIPYHLMQNLPLKTQEAWENIIKLLKSHNVKIKEITLPMLEYGISIYYILTSAEASTNLSKYDGVRYGHRTDKKDTIDELFTQTRCEGFGEEVKRRILLGTFVLSANERKSYYLKAQAMREIMKNQSNEIFADCDAICLPTYSDIAPKSFTNKNDPTKEYLNDFFTVFAALTETPAMSLPMGTSPENGLPLGIQICANKFQENKIYSIAQKIENAKLWKGFDYITNTSSPQEYSKLFTGGL